MIIEGTICTHPNIGADGYCEDCGWERIMIVRPEIEPNYWEARVASWWSDRKG